MPVQSLIRIGDGPGPFMPKHIEDTSLEVSMASDRASVAA